MENPGKLRLAYFDSIAYERVSLRLYGDDAMYQDNTLHYLSVGASALNLIRGVQFIASISDFRRILDFGSGAGRVTRWLRAAYPAAVLDVADVRAGDLAFCAETFGAQTWDCGIAIDAMQAPGAYDLIWVGSVITHLSDTRAEALLEKLVEWLAVGGIALVSFHGRSAYSWRSTLNYIPAYLLPRIERAFEAGGYGYSDYPGRTDYGVSFCTSSWMVSTVQQNLQCRLVMLAERAWDDHHDVVGLQRIA
jgi:SAM-dependent methyltransferase